MTSRRRAPSEAGFTLPELLVAITILGIIMVAIGAMITTSFRTSETVAAELQGSRGPKVVSRYWVPDVEQSESVTQDPTNCGTGDALVATISSYEVASAFASPTDVGLGQPSTIAWWEVAGTRTQLVRFVCGPGAPSTRLVVVSDLEGVPEVAVDGSRSTITVTVPDKSRPNDEYEFSVTATSQITTTTSAP